MGNVAIIGVGMIGASIGLALRSRETVKRVIGIGRDAESLALAARLGAIDEFHLKLNDAVRSAKFIVVATPVNLIPRMVLEAYRLNPTAYITDAGSTKARIVGTIEKDLPRGHRYVGAHPLAGSERSGPAAGSALLFAGKTCVLTPTVNSAPDAVDRITRFWQLLGMHVVQKSPAEHDQIIARTSHLPHLAAAALSEAAGPPDSLLAGAGLKDSTRIASGEPDLWTAILLDNRECILGSLEKLEAVLARYRTALERSDGITLRQLLANGKQNRDALGY